MQHTFIYIFTASVWLFAVADCTIWIQYSICTIHAHVYVFAWWVITSICLITDMIIQFYLFSAEKIYEDFREFRATLLSNGTVRWEPGGVFKTMCEIDITYYPFDEQHCKMQFGAWTYHTVKMNLSNMEVNVNLDSYKENGEWEIAGTEVKRDEFAYECCPDERFSNVEFLIKMRRRHTFYILNVILPSIMTSVLLLSIFFCTPGQKVQIGVVVLLSFRIFLLNVAGNIPKTSDHIPILGTYVF